MKGDVLRLDWTDHSTIRLLQNGVEFFPVLCAAINDALVSVHLETYIFKLDRTGLMVLDSLENAARRGVKVRVVLDGFGSADTADAISARLALAGAQCRIFRPEPRRLARFIPTRNRLRRLHRKVTVVDAQVAFIGGINIIDDYDDIDATDTILTPRFDFAVQVRGSLVADAVHAQELLWVGLNWAHLRKSPRDWRHMRLLRPRYVAGEEYGWQRAALVLRDNLRYRQTFERAYLYAIQNARRDILIANAYFFPGRQFRKELARAAARGVRVRLLLQGKVEYRMQYHATRSIYGQLLRGGIEIHEYMPAYLHAKVAVIDNMAVVGSSNLDPFSLLLAREANVIVDDQPWAWELKSRLEEAILRGGKFIRPLEYERRGLLRRGVDAASYALLRVGVALSGKAGDY